MMPDHRAVGLRRPRVCIVGSGMHFISGPSYYTYFLSQAFAETSDVSVILMRALVPRFLYPGRSRVGAPISPLSTRGFAPTFDGIDWTLVPSLPRALRFFRQHRPDVLVLEWWSASCLPAYLALSKAARYAGIPVVLELHEDLHASEAKIPLAGPLAARGLRHLVVTADAHVVHSPSDFDTLVERYAVDPGRVLTVHHGPFNMAGHVAVRERGADDPNTILFFGTVRPYKGLEVLVEAFDRLCEQQPGRWRLIVVGEPWEGWRLPFDKVAASPNRTAIETVARYVRDEEIPEYFSRALVLRDRGRRARVRGLGVQGGRAGAAGGPRRADAGHPRRPAALPLAVRGSPLVEHHARGVRGAVRQVAPGLTDGTHATGLTRRRAVSRIHGLRRDRRTLAVSWHR